MTVVLYRIVQHGGTFEALFGSELSSRCDHGKTANHVTEVQLPAKRMLALVGGRDKTGRNGSSKNRSLAAIASYDGAGNRLSGPFAGVIELAEVNHPNNYHFWHGVVLLSCNAASLKRRWATRAARLVIIYCQFEDKRCAIAYLLGSKKPDRRGWSFEHVEIALTGVSPLSVPEDELQNFDRLPDLDLQRSGDALASAPASALSNAHRFEPAIDRSPSPAATLAASRRPPITALSTCGGRRFFLNRRSGLAGGPGGDERPGHRVDPLTRCGRMPTSTSPLCGYGLS